MKNYKNLTEIESLAYSKCPETLFTQPFYMMTIDGQRLGDPITEEQAKFLLQWFKTVIYEYNEQLDKWDRV